MIATLDRSQMDRVRGVLVGTAAGDALGAGYEFGPALSDDTPVVMDGGGPFRWEPGEWTDDTAMAIAIAEVASTGADLRRPAGQDAIVNRWIEWMHGAKDVGSQTREVLSLAGDGGAEAARAAARRLHEKTGRTAGNGALMRTAPVALAFLDDPSGMARAATALAGLTHYDPEAGEASALWCLAIRHAVLSGEIDPRAVLDDLPTDRASVWAARLDDAERSRPADFIDNGWVVQALQAAWSAIATTRRPGTDADPADHLRRGLEAAVRGGRDADTVAAIAGGLLGAAYGASALPDQWRAVLHGWPGLTATGLADLATATVTAATDSAISSAGRGSTPAADMASSGEGLGIMPPGWDRLRARLAGVSDTVTILWRDLDRLVGGLPDSAYRHAAYWSGTRGKWPGFRARARVDDSVTFTREDSPRSTALTGGPARSARVTSPTGRAALGSRDILLVGCVKSKLDHPAPAKELYRSALFRLERSYAEAAGGPWFILSAKYGLVDPDQMIGPYELFLGKTPASYRQEWGRQIVRDLAARAGPLTGKTIEVHASSQYVDAILDRLREAGATVVQPLAGLQLGERLHWYKNASATSPTTAAADRQTDTEAYASALRDRSRARTPEQFLAHHRPELDSPGLYSWWVDQPGADDLTHGLGQPISPGMIYAGLAGATRTKSNTRSANTLWLRIKTMHLGSNHHMSTLRWSLGAILAETAGSASIDETALTGWMRTHLTVVAIPVADPGTLAALETGVLSRLDPPLNLAKVPRTALRMRLSRLRRTHGGRREPQSEPVRPQQY